MEVLFGQTLEGLKSDANTGILPCTISSAHCYTLVFKNPQDSGLYTVFISVREKEIIIRVV